MDLAKLREIFDEYDNREPKFLSNKEAETVMAWLRPMLSATQDMEELRKAAEMLADDPLWRGKYKVDEEGRTRGDDYQLRAIVRDAQKLAKHFLDELARRDAEQAERNRPIDEEWLRSIGGMESRGVWFFDGVVGRFTSGQWWVGYAPIADASTRGRFLDLINLLKGGA
jgi:hypothetical protein